MSYVERYEYILLDHLHELAHRKIVDVDPERVLDLARSRLDPEEAVSWGWAQTPPAIEKCGVGDRGYETIAVCLRYVPG